MLKYLIGTLSNLDDNSVCAGLLFFKHRRFLLLTLMTINRLAVCFRRVLVRDAKIGHILKDLMKKITLFVQIIRMIIKLICKSFGSIVSLIIT